MCAMPGAGIMDCGGLQALAAGARVPEMVVKVSKEGGSTENVSEVALRTINTLRSFGHSFDYLDFVPVLNQATKKELLATTPCSSPSLSSRRKSSTVPRPVLRGSISQAPQASAAATPELYRSLLALLCYVLFHC